jgi:hypothetical protein
VWHRAISDGDITLGYIILFSQCFFYIFSSYRCIDRFYFNTGDSRFYFGDICDNNDIPAEEFARIENLIVGFFGHNHQSVQEHPPNEAARFYARGSLHRNFDASQGESQLRALGISAAEVQRALLREHKTTLDWNWQSPRKTSVSSIKINLCWIFCNELKLLTHNSFPQQLDVFISETQRPQNRIQRS